MQSCTSSECRTVNGQLIEFTCERDEVASVTDFIKNHIGNIDIPTTGRVNMSHGGYGQYTRYDITQHGYSGGRGGFFECLEIKNPPNGRNGAVTYVYSAEGMSYFIEWETLTAAQSAYKAHCVGGDLKNSLRACEGFVRLVECGALTPWFYAIGTEELIGDYAFPEGLQDDPVYRFGKKFIVPDKQGLPAVKTCMGTRLREREREEHPYGKYSYRLVYWDDGSVWDESGTHHWWSSEKLTKPPREIVGDELEIAQAVQQFKEFLAGKTEAFSIDLTNGAKFKGKLVMRDKETPCPAGDYLISAVIQDKKEPSEGWVMGFTPTREIPTVLLLAEKKLREKGQIPLRMIIVKSRIKKGGKKWSGVYLPPFDA